MRTAFTNHQSPICPFCVFVSPCLCVEISLMEVVERVLVKEVNWLGDIVMSLPALRAVRKAFPTAKLSVLIKKELASFFEGAAWIDEIIPYKLRKGFVEGLSDRKGILRVLKERKLDLA